MFSMSIISDQFQHASVGWHMRLKHIAIALPDDHQCVQPAPRSDTSVKEISFAFTSNPLTVVVYQSKKT